MTARPARQPDPVPDAPPPGAFPGAAATPVMAQYHEIKSAHPGVLLFFRMGDFYELFFDDAIAAAEALDIALTKRGKQDGADIPMCGVPVHAAEFVSREADPRRLQGRDLRTDRGPGRGKTARQQGAGEARRRAGRDRRYVDRGRAA